MNCKFWKFVIDEFLNIWQNFFIFFYSIGSIVQVIKVIKTIDFCLRSIFVPVCLFDLLVLQILNLAEKKK